MTSGEDLPRKSPIEGNKERRIGGIFGWWRPREGYSPWVILAYLSVVAVFIWMLSNFYVQGKGFSYFLFFGDRQTSVISELKEVDYYVHRNWGYDGQFYAQISVDPTLRHPELSSSIDNLGYRGRRILMSALAYVMGRGEPERILFAYTLQNIIAWFGLALLLLYWFPPISWGNCYRWSGVLLSAGVWGSVLRALVDGPSLLLIAIGVFLIETKRPWLAASVLGLSGLAKETNILGLTLFFKRDSLFNIKKWPGLGFKVVLILFPLLLWILYVRNVVGSISGDNLRHFTWPLVGWWEAVLGMINDTFSPRSWSGGPFKNYSFLCLLGFLGLGVQFFYFIIFPQWEKPWWRIGITFSLLMSVLAQPVWEGYQSIAAFRVLLPMQLAFNVLVPHTRRWFLILILGNFSVFTEIPAIRHKPEKQTIRAVSD